MTSALPYTPIYLGTTSATALHIGTEKKWPPDPIVSFTPDELTGLAVWLDALDYLPGNWPNKAAGGAATTFIASPDPAWSTTTKNGLPVVRFRVDQGRLRIPSGAGVDDEWTLVYVARMVPGWTSGRVVSGIYTPNNILVGYWNGYQDVMYDNGFTSPDVKTPVVVDQWKTYSGDGTTGLSRLFSDSILLSSTTTSQGWGGTFALNGYSASGTEETSDCEVAEVVMYDRKLSDEERLQVEQYLRAKWWGGVVTPLLPHTLAYRGTTPTTAVYQGTEKVWPPGPSAPAAPVSAPLLAGQDGDWVTRGWGTAGWQVFDGNSSSVYRAVNWPAGVTVTTTGAQYTWNASVTHTSGITYYDHPAGSRVHVCLYGTPFSVTVTFAQAWSGTLRAYFMSYQNDDRLEKVTTFHNGVEQNQIDLVSSNSASWFGSGIQLPAMLPGGRWVAWDLNMAAGDVLRFDISLISGANCVISGLTFDAAAPPVWTPDALAGLTTWLDAADYLPGSWPNRVAGGAVPTIVGTPTMAWSGTTLNGLPTVRFKTNEGRLRSTWPHPPHDWTLVYLVRWAGPNAGRAFTVQYPPSNLLVGMHTSAPDQMYDNGTWLSAGVGWNVWSPGPGPWRMYGSDSAGGVGSRFFIDGAQVGTTISNLGAQEGFYNGWALSGYDATGTGETMDIEVAELLLWNRKLSDEERQQAEHYLQEKWIGLS